MDNSNHGQLSQPPVSTRTPTGKPKFLLFFFFVLVVAGLAFGIFYFVKDKPSNPTPVEPELPVVVPTDPTVDWDIYTNTQYGLSFKYPQGYVVSEPSSGFLTLRTKDEHVPQGGISIDARQQGSNASFTDAQKSIEGSFTISNSKQMNGWAIFDAVGKEEMLKGIRFKFAIANYKNGAIKVETIDSAPYSDIFEQVLSTVKFIN